MDNLHTLNLPPQTLTNYAKLLQNPEVKALQINEAIEHILKIPCKDPHIKATLREYIISIIEEAILQYSNPDQKETEDPHAQIRVLLCFMREVEALMRAPTRSAEEVLAYLERLPCLAVDLPYVGPKASDAEVEARIMGMLGRSSADAYLVQRVTAVDPHYEALCSV